MKEEFRKIIVDPEKALNRVLEKNIPFENTISHNTQVDDSIDVLKEGVYIGKIIRGEKYSDRTSGLSKETFEKAKNTIDALFKKQEVARNILEKNSEVFKQIELEVDRQSILLDKLSDLENEGKKNSDEYKTIFEEYKKYEEKIQKLSQTADGDLDAIHKIATDQQIRDQAEQRAQALYPKNKNMN